MYQAGSDLHRNWLQQSVGRIVMDQENSIVQKGVEGKATSLNQKVHVATFADPDRDFPPLTKALLALHPWHFYCDEACVPDE